MGIWKDQQRKIIFMIDLKECRLSGTLLLFKECKLFPCDFAVTVSLFVAL